jgi:Restriction endonuclease ThaI
MQNYQSVYDILFDKEEYIKSIQNKLPELFLLAEVENSRNGKLGMEVGSARERIIIALLMHIFGVEDVDTNLPITLSEVDVVVKNQPLSIKTVTGVRIPGVKLIWSVDAQKAQEFKDHYEPGCDLMLAQINWQSRGSLYLFSRQTQQDVLERIGRDLYIKLPKKGTNSRGVELSGIAIQNLIQEPTTRKIEIDFKRTELDYRAAYSRWLDYWNDL